MKTRLSNFEYQPAPELPSLWENLFPFGLLEELRTHAFLTACREGRVDIGTLRRFLIQQHYYSQYFTRYLCAMMANLNENSDVRALAENLFEEMGLNEKGAITHAELYQQCMRAAGTKPGSEPILPETRGLIDAMFHYCRSGDALEGLAALCLGAEAIVPEVYGAVLVALRRAGVPHEGLRFFVLHVSEDEGHAIVMRRIIDKMLAKHPHRRAKVIAIGEDMVRLRMTMLDAVFERAYVEEHV
jgi:pyrroloquinoline-quinone synthase